jgi:hypothetical protein
MKRRSLFVAALVLAMTLSPAGVRAFGVHDVIKLHQEQVSDSLIALAIQHSGKVIHVTSSDFRQLKQAGVSDEVMSALLRTEQVGFQSAASRHYAVAPVYVHYPYDPLPWQHSSFAFGFTYGYGGYPWPAFRPYVVRHYRYPFRRW